MATVQTKISCRGDSCTTRGTGHDGGGIFSFIHLGAAAAAAAAAIVLAVEHEGPAVYNIVDDEPATVREWLPVLASALGAKPLRHVRSGSRG
jgi:nucleoside-diphosphate-sugar epimerase